MKILKQGKLNIYWVDINLNQHVLPLINLYTVKIIFRKKSNNKNFTPFSHKTPLKS
jgi:hypothetical protein